MERLKIGIVLLQNLKILGKLIKSRKFKSSEDDKEEDQKKSALNIKKSMNQTNDI